MPIETATKISELDAANPVGASDLPSTIDDHIRLIKTVLKADAASTSGGAGVYVGTVGGTADAITLAPTAPILAYAAGLSYAWIASGANTGATTLAVSGLAAKAVKKNGTTALAAGDIPSGALVRATYDGTNFQITVVADRATLGVTAGSAQQVDQAVTAWTRATTTALGTTLQGTLSDTSATVTGFSGMVAGLTYKFRSLGAGILAHHATNLIITQTGASITTEAGDTGEIYALTATTCRIINYVRASGKPLVGAQLDTSQVWTGRQSSLPVTVNDGASITLDLVNLYSAVVPSLGGNRTIENPNNIVAGVNFAVDLPQDSTGSRVASWGWMWPSAGLTLSTSPSVIDRVYAHVPVYATSTVTITLASPGVVTWTAHGLMNGQKVRLTTTGTLPTGLAINTTYYVRYVSANTFQLSATKGGAAINTSESQSGTHTCIAGTIDATVKKDYL